MPSFPTPISVTPMPKSFFGFDMIVLATDSFFMAMFFFLSGLFVWPGIARKGPLNYLSRSPASARPALRDLRVHGHSARLLRDLAAAPSRDRLFGILVEDGHEGPWPSGPIWFLWVLFAFDLVACLLYRLSPDLVDPINRLSQHGRRPARRVLRGPAGRHRCVLRSRAALFRSEPAGSNSGRSTYSTAACCTMRVLPDRRGHWRCAI